MLCCQLYHHCPHLNPLPLCTALPQIAALPETKEVTVGSDAVLPCVASGYPVPEIKWSKVTKNVIHKNLIFQDGVFRNSFLILYAVYGLNSCQLIWLEESKLSGDIC